MLLGDPAYYGRFGFVPAGPLGLTYEPAGPGNPNLLVRLLGGADVGEVQRGEFRYCWE